jgi:hypothetical protein
LFSFGFTTIESGCLFGKNAISSLRSTSLLLIDQLSLIFSGSLNVLRYSEILLMKAEAQGAGADAAATLKPYFTNRYATSPAEASIAALNVTDFQNLILIERRKEFFGEGQWWYDLKRTGRTDLLTTLNGRNFLMYYPVPQSQKDIAGYTQNDGY